MASRRQRTPGHVTADVGVAHAALIAAEAGCTTLSVPGGADYGFDVPVMTFDDLGRPEPGYLFLQVKSTATLKTLSSRHVAVRIKRKHLKHWASEPMPVILIRYSMKQKKAYWLYVQNDLERTGLLHKPLPAVVTLRVPSDQVLTPESFLLFREFKRRIITQLRGQVSHA